MVDSYGKAATQNYDTIRVRSCIKKDEAKVDFQAFRVTYKGLNIPNDGNEPKIFIASLVVKIMSIRIGEKRF